MHISVPAGKLFGSVLLGLVVLVPILLIAAYWQWVVAIVGLVFLIALVWTLRDLRKARIPGTEENLVDQAGRAALTYAYEVEKELGATDAAAGRAGIQAMLAAQSQTRQEIAAARAAEQQRARAAAEAAVTRRRAG